MILFLGAIIDEVQLIKNALSEKPFFLSDIGEAMTADARICGIGSVEAALNLQELLIELGNVDEIIFLGSAGSYSERSCEFAFSNTFTRKDIASVQGQSRIPDLMSSKIETRVGPLAASLIRSLDLPGGTVNSTDSITLVSVSDSFPGGFENLEAYGLACAAARRNIPFSCIMPVTNSVGPEGSLEWRKNFRIMSDTLQKRILSQIKTA